MNKYRIQRFSTNLSIAAGQQTGSSAAGFEVNGILRGITVSAPAMTNATFTIAIKDGNSLGHTLFTSGNLDKAVVTPIFLFDANNPMMIPLSGKSTLTITSLGVEVAQRDFSIELLIDRG